MRMRRRMNFGAVHLFGLRHAFQKKHHSPPNGSDVNGLIRGVEDEDGFLHQGSTMGCERGDVPANQIPRSARHRHSTRFGDVSPPVVKGVWSSRCAHRASFGYLRVTNETQRAPAILSPSTHLAPASHNAREHASSVALVVITSSSSRIRKLSTRPPVATAKTPRTVSERVSDLTRRRAR